MTKDDLKNICTGPKQKWLAIPMNGDEAFEFGFEDIDLISGDVCLWNKSLDVQHDLSDCYLCASTGYTDSRGDEVFGGQLFSDDTENKFLVYWHAEHMQWLARQLALSFDCSEELSKWPSSEIRNIGHIHIQPWPDEVSKILSEAK